MFAVLFGLWVLISPTPCSASEFRIGEYRALSLFGEAGLLPDTDYVSFTGDFGFSRVLPARDAIEEHISGESALLGNFALSVINLEFMLPGSSGDERDRQIEDVVLHLLQATGFDVISRANNHAMDFGLEGYNHNTRRLQEAGYAMIGIRPFPVYLTELGGSRIAIFALTDYTDRSDSEGLVLKINENDLELVKKQTSTADLRIAFVHLGSMSFYPSPHERRQIGRLLDAGADLVVCTGSHFLKGFVYERGNPVAYGLGNHLFSYTGDDTEPIGMHLVAGFRRGRLAQLFAVPFLNTIMKGKSGPLSESHFAAFSKALLDRSTTDSRRYFSDPDSLSKLKAAVQNFRLSRLFEIRPRHAVYAFGILYHQYPLIIIGGCLLSLALIMFFARWMLLRHRSPKRSGLTPPG